MPSLEQGLKAGAPGRTVTRRRGPERAGGDGLPGPAGLQPARNVTGSDDAVFPARSVAIATTSCSPGSLGQVTW